MKKYAKLFPPVLLTVLGALAVTLQDDKISIIEWIGIATGAFQAISVYIIPNVPEFPWAKSLVAAALAALGGLTSAIAADGVTRAVWINIAVLALSAVGVAGVRNTGDYLDEHRRMLAA